MDFLLYIIMFWVKLILGIVVLGALFFIGLTMPGLFCILLLFIIPFCFKKGKDFLNETPEE